MQTRKTLQFGVTCVAFFALVGGSIDPVTKRYVSTLRAGYLPIVAAFSKAVEPCTKTPPTAASLASCRTLDAIVVTDTQTLLTSLGPIQVPAAARAADRQFRGAMKALLSSINGRIKYIDANDLVAFKKADGAVSYALELSFPAIAALNRAIKSAHLPVLYSLGP